MPRKIATTGLIVSALLFWGCPKNGDDEIRLSSASGITNAGVLLDGRRAACAEDEVYRTSSNVLIPNVLTDDSSCKARLAVFAQNTAFHYSTPTWTDNPDVLSVTMPSPERMRLAVWMVVGFLSDAQMDVNNARQLYNGMQCGIDFQPATVTDVTTHPKAPSLATASCADAAKLQGLASTPGHLNIYYVKEIAENGFPRGKVCPGYPAIVLVKLEAPIETLAHELGHVLTLSHSNDPNVPAQMINNMGPANLMMSEGSERDQITTGQCFRCNLNATSGIQTTKFGSRAGISPGCPPALAGPICPGLDLDITPK